MASRMNIGRTDGQASVVSPDQRRVTIYSWNMLFRNERLQDAIGFIISSDFDIFCLQEVPERMLERLRSLGLPMTCVTEREVLLDRGPVKNFSVILSRLPIERDGEIPFPAYPLPRRARWFLRLAKPIGLRNVRNCRTQFADVRTPAGTVRIFNLHLLLMASPAWRLKELDTAFECQDPSLPSVFCGDFNLIESPRVSLLNWMFGGSFMDMLDFGRERRMIERHIARRGLGNPLRGRITHAFGGSQLDHILVPSSFHVHAADVISKRHGSDHHPIRVCIQASEPGSTVRT